MSTDIVSRQASEALQAVPQFTRTLRHARSVLRHSTPRKVFNLLRVEMEYRLRRTVVRGRPYILIVDPISVCNLRCPLCPTGRMETGRKDSLMPWETFTRVIDELAPWAYEVNLYNWGESILHPHVFDMIAYARKANLATSMSANLNDVREGVIDKIIESGLENLTLSFDGATQENYAKYRVRGDLETVLANARELVQRKRELKSRTPHIEWQFIVFQHNAHEIDAARALATEIGVDEFRVIPPGLPFEVPDPAALKEEWFVQKEGGGYEEFRGQIESPCFYLYRSFTTNPDGGTAPCCVVNGEKNDFGHIIDHSFDEIWNNEKYQSARALFRNGGKSSTPTVCDDCDLFAKPGGPNTSGLLKIENG